MTLLVAGGDRVDAGKTTFTTGLLARLDGVGFKPRAGNDHWFDHDDYRHAVEDGRLYGKDAKRLTDATASDLAPEDVNPVHRLWRPSPNSDTGLVGRADRQFVLDRVGDEFVVNAHAEIPESARRNLPLDDPERVERVETVDELDDATRRHHLPALERLAERIGVIEPAVVESYGDVAVPIRGVEFDTVAVVEPRRMRVYDGDRYLKARGVASGSSRDGRLEARVSDVVELLDPEAVASLPPLDGETQADSAAVADAYETAYDELLALD